MPRCWLRKIRFQPLSRYAVHPKVFGVTTTGFMWGVIIRPCLNFNDDFVKPTAV